MPVPSSFMLLAVPGLLRNLPQPTLAAVVITAALSLADVAGIPRLWSVRRTEFALAMAAFLGVALLGVLPGIALAVLLSILIVFRRAWWRYRRRRRVDRLPGYHDTRTHESGSTIKGLKILRFDPPLLFANADRFVTGQGAGCGRPTASLDRGGGRADHRCRHYGSRHA